MYKFKNSFIGYFRFYYQIVGNRLILFLILSSIISCLDSFGLAMFIPLLQSVSDAKTSGLNGDHFDFLYRMMNSMGVELNAAKVLLIMMVLFIFKGLVRWIQLTYYSKLRQIFISRIRLNLIDSLQQLSFESFIKIEAGRIQNTLTVEVQRLFQTMKSYFDSAQACVMLLTYMILAFVANFNFAFLVAIGAMLSNLLYRRIYKATKKVSVALSSRGNDFNSHLSQSTMYFKYLKSTNMYSRYATKLKNVIKDSAYLQRRIGNMNAITTSVKEPMIMVMVAGAMIIQVNVLGASLLTLILSLMLFYRALNYLVVVQNHWQGFIENIGGMSAVANLIDDMNSLRENKGVRSYDGLKKGIVVDDVTLEYSNRRVLNHLTLRIPRLSTVALVGESGSGKTTLANLVAGLITPTKGRILVDDVDLRDLDLDQYRSRVGYISQETVVFNDSIYNNITFWDTPDEANLARFWQVVEIASLKEFIASSPDKEHTLLGDSGILISGGQKQRICIARELYKNAQVLIFDEATSALDSETEKIIQKNIERLYGQYTILIVAHRLSTIKAADTIYLLESGRVAAKGSFDEMVEQSEKFQRLVQLQMF